MIIKSDKENALVGVIALVLVLLVDYVFIDLGAVWVAVCMPVLAVIMFGLYTIATCRTITMDAEGCTVSLLKYQRRYLWKDLAIKRVEGPHFGLGLTYHDGGAFFSVKPVKKKRTTNPVMYCAFRHPFTCFFVFFVPHRNAADRKNVEMKIYEVDKQEFLNRMKEWNVDIEPER